MKRILPVLFLLALFLGVYFWRTGVFESTPAKALQELTSVPGSEIELYLSRTGLVVEYDEADPITEVTVSKNGEAVQSPLYLLVPNKALYSFALDPAAEYHAVVKTRHRSVERKLNPATDTRGVELSSFRLELPEKYDQRGLYFTPDSSGLLLTGGSAGALLFAPLEGRNVDLKGIDALRPPGAPPLKIDSAVFDAGDFVVAARGPKYLAVGGCGFSAGTPINHPMDLPYTPAFAAIAAAQQVLGVVHGAGTGEKSVWGALGLQNGAVLWKQTPPGPGTPLRFFNFGGNFAVLLTDTALSKSGFATQLQLRTLNPATGAELGRWTCERTADSQFILANGFAVAPDNAAAVLATNDGRVICIDAAAEPKPRWSVTIGAVQQFPSGPAGAPPIGCALSGDHVYVLTGAAQALANPGASATHPDANSIFVLDARTGETIDTIALKTRGVLLAARDGLVAVGSTNGKDGTLTLYRQGAKSLQLMYSVPLTRPIPVLLQISEKGALSAVVSTRADADDGVLMSTLQVFY